MKSFQKLTNDSMDCGTKMLTCDDSQLQLFSSIVVLYHSKFFLNRTNNTTIVIFISIFLLKKPWFLTLLNTCKSNFTLFNWFSKRHNNEAGKLDYEADKH